MKRYQVQLSVRIQAVTETGGYLSENLELTETVMLRQGADIMELLGILGKVHEFSESVKRTQ